MLTIPAPRGRFRLPSLPLSPLAASGTEAKPAGVYIMLTRRSADEHEDDNTITRCMRRAQRLGAGGIVV